MVPHLNPEPMGKQWGNVEFCRKVFVDKWKKMLYNLSHDKKNTIIYINFFNRKKDYNISIKQKNPEKNFKKLNKSLLL